jgi:hypothetical protein
VTAVEVVAGADISNRFVTLSPQQTNQFQPLSQHNHHQFFFTSPREMSFYAHQPRKIEDFLSMNYVNSLGSHLIMMATTI